MRIAKTYLQYGIQNNIAEDLAQRNIPVTTFKATSNKNLAAKYGLDETTIVLVKKHIMRQPIPEDVIDMLLEASNFTCCVCKGIKGKSYLIHHIEEYSKSQDNSYRNLAVVCPNCHDLAHRNPGLTNQLTPGQIARTKAKWEQQVEKYNVEAAARNGSVFDVDYVNIPRIIELALAIFKEIPHTALSDDLIRDKILAPPGELVNNGNILSFGYDAIRIKHHFVEIFQGLIPRIAFENLDDLLNKKAIQRNDFIGTFCFYVGGLYGQGSSLAKLDENKIARLSMRRRGYYCEFLIDPMFVTSNTSLVRFREHSVYIIYGKIKSIGEKAIGNKKHIKIDIRPFLVGIPTKTMHRKPAIAYIRELEEYEEEGLDMSMEIGGSNVSEILDEFIDTDEQLYR